MISFTLWPIYLLLSIGWGAILDAVVLKIPKHLEAISAAGTKIITIELKQSLDTTDQICFNIYVIQLGVAYRGSCELETG
jgi:hypothetical protein